MVCMPSIQKISGHPVKPVPSRFRVRWRQLWVDVQTIVASSVMVIRYIHEANSFWSHGLVSTCGPHLLVISQALFITSVRRDCLLVASRYLLRGSVYHLVIQHSHGKSPCLIGKPSINGPFSMAMLNNQRVILKPISMTARKNLHDHVSW